MGDFVHGKKTKHPTYYSNAVEPIILRELWEECQVQKKKNAKSYQITLTYLCLQKIKCPHCNRILGVKATKKKNNAYYYYYCSECKYIVKDRKIEEKNKILNYIDNVNDMNNDYKKMPKLSNPLNNVDEELKKIVILLIFLLKIMKH